MIAHRTKFAIVLLLGALGAAGCGASQTMDNKEARDVLQIAATTAVAYGVTHSGSYNGMDAAGLGLINGQLKWTDAEPEPGQVQVESAEGDNYVFVYKNPRGGVFTATRAGGKIAFTDSKGNSI